jgi:hypothetical protein
MCPPMLFKLRPCIQKLCNVYYPPTPSLGWIGQIKSRSLSLASARSASWLAYSLHPRSLTPIWSWMQGWQNRCPPMNNNIAPMPTQNPWAWVGMGMGTQCRALMPIYVPWLRAKNGHQKDMGLKEIKLLAQNLLTVLGWTMDMIGGGGVCMII